MLISNRFVSAWGASGAMTLPPNRDGKRLGTAEGWELGVVKGHEIGTNTPLAVDKLPIAVFRWWLETVTKQTKCGACC